jgi:hypothetical protein
MRSALENRSGKEMDVIDPKKRIESIGSFGDLKAGWYFQSDTSSMAGASTVPPRR